MKVWIAAGLTVAFFAVGGWRIYESAPYAPSAAAPAATPLVGPLTAATRAARNAPAGSVRVMLVGNSVATLLAPAFKVATPPVAVLDESVAGCGFPPELTGVTLHLPNGQVIAQPACDPGWEPGAVERFRPNIVFWMVSDTSGTGGTYQSTHVSPCDPRYDTLYRKRLEQEVAILRGRDARVVITTEAYSRYLGVSKYDHATDCENADRRATASASGARLVDLFGYVCPAGRCRTKVNGVVLRPDGLHYSGAGATLVAQWLLDQARA